MEKLPDQPKSHLLICCRDKSGKECCADKNADELVDDLKKWVKENGLKKQLKVSKSSCLGYCESGITACLYPQNLWLHRIKSKDINEIKNLLIESTK